MKPPSPLVEGFNSFRSEHLFEHCSLPIAASDKDLKFTRVNKAFLDVFGYSEEEIYQMDVPQVSIGFDHSMAKGFIKTIEQQKIDSITIEKTYRIKNGETFPAKVTITGIYDDQGRFLETVAIIQDLSTFKENENSLKRMNERLRVFAHTASHDLREPLRNIHIYSNFLIRDSLELLDPENQEFLKFISENAKRMSKLIQGILAFAEASNKQEEFEAIKMYEVVNFAKENLKTLIEKKAAEVEVIGQLPFIWGHHASMVQLFQNLFSNSIYYTPEGRRPSILVHSNDSASYHIISIHDNGKGIPPKHLNDIFTPFNSLYRKNKTRGNGLGLATCRNIVEAHGGEISVSSEVGKGSVFYLKFKKHELPI